MIQYISWEGDSMVWISKNSSVLVLNAPAGRHSIPAVHSANEFHPGFIMTGKNDLEFFPPEAKKKIP